MLACRYHRRSPPPPPQKLGHPSAAPSPPFDGGRRSISGPDDRRHHGMGWRLPFFVARTVYDERFSQNDTLEKALKGRLIETNRATASGGARSFRLSFIFYLHYKTLRAISIFFAYGGGGGGGRGYSPNKMAGWCFHRNSNNVFVN